MNIQKRMDSTCFLSGKLTVPHRAICGVNSRWTVCFIGSLEAKTMSLSKRRNAGFLTFSNNQLDHNAHLHSLSTWLLQPFETHSMMTTWMPGVFHAVNSITHLMTYSGLGDFRSSKWLAVLPVFWYIFSGLAKRIPSCHGREKTGITSQDVLQSQGLFQCSSEALTKGEPHWT